MNSKMTILMVDDSPLNLQVLAQTLAEDYLLKAATSGEKCLEIARNNKQPDLILLDVEMPGMDGYEVIKQLKENVETQNIPVIFITGKNEEADEELGISLGANDYITKPIRPAIVKARVNNQIQLKRLYDDMQDLALRDQLTGLYNRHYFVEAVKQRIAHNKRHHTGLSLLLVDIDHFKQVNDKHGHSKGDEVIKAVADSLKLQIRHSDIATRWGGEEFLILLEVGDTAILHAKAQSIVSFIEQKQLGQLAVTVSIGCSPILLEDDDFQPAFERADKALYDAKSGGRNCALMCVPELTT